MAHLFEPTGEFVCLSMLKHGRDVLRDRSRSALLNETLTTKSGSELPEFLGINKVRTSAPGVHYQKAEELYWTKQSLGIGDMQATIFSIRVGNTSAEDSKHQTSRETRLRRRRE
jgi:hypothetical protein